MSAVGESFVCDKCGADVENGGVFSALVASDIDMESGAVVNYHWCRDRVVDGKKIKGCASKVLSAANLDHYRQSTSTSP